jgi:AcrR family transcriptional regulator
MARYKKRGIRPGHYTEIVAANAVISLFLREGWNKVTYRGIAVEMGMTRGAVERVLPNKAAIRAIASGVAVNCIFDGILLDSEDTIEMSWKGALTNSDFRHCVAFLVAGVQSGKEERKVIVRCLGELSASIGEELLDRMLGESIRYMVADKWEENTDT